MNQQPGKNIKNKKTIYYDGSCLMCTTIAEKVDETLLGERFQLEDTHAGALPKNITKEQVEKEIYLTDAKGHIYKGAEAILRILEEHPRWKFLSKIGQLPIIKQLLSIGYGFISRNRHLVYGPAGRIFWLKAVVSVGFIAGLLLSINLWIGERFFPLIPVFDNLLGLSSLIETVLFLLLVGLLFSIIFAPRPQKLIFCILFITGYFVLFDQMRLQPWVYQYFFMLAILGLFSWNRSHVKKQQGILNTLRLMVASTYLFSGLQKVNPIFMGAIFPWLAEPVANLFPAQLQIFFLSFGLIAPSLEIVIGVSLLIKRYRRYAIILALAMHSFILFVLGPLGHNWNIIVWPWNIVMGLIVVILFWRVDNFSFRDALSVKNFPFQKVVFILFVIMPILSFFNKWDSYLSAALYSGNTNSAQIYISESVTQNLPAKVRSYVNKSETGDNVLDLSGWSSNELGVPPYPETRIYKSVLRDICRYTEEDNDIILFVYGKQTLFNKDDELMFNCSDF